MARVYLSPGSGNFEINNRPSDEYLNNELLSQVVQQPFDVLEKSIKNYDLKVKVRGGGVSGQTDAIRLAIARALQKIEPEDRPALKAAGLLKVDSRKVERKKYGKPKARKSFQFSKR